MKNSSIQHIISTWAIALFFTQLSYAQTTLANFLQKKETSDLIFEGEVIDQVAEHSTSKATLLTINTVRIHKIFQGGHRDSICEIVTPGGFTDDRFLIYGKALQLSTGDVGLFWVKKGAIPFSEGDAGQTSRYWSMEQSDFLPLGTNYSEQKASGESLNLFEEVSRSLGAPRIEFPKSKTSTGAESVDCSDPNFDNWAQISLQNFQITNNYTALECDVVLKAYPSGLKFGKGQVSFTLPKSAFGTNVVVNQTLVVTKGEILASSNYSISYGNLSDSTVLVQISQLSSGATAFDLTGTFKTLLHLKVTITNALQITSIKPESFNFSGQLEYLCSGRYFPFRRTDFVAPSGIFPPNFENPIGIHYSLDRFYSDGGNAFRFDIFASSDNLSNYKSGKLYVDYDNTTFGSSIASSIIPVAGALSGNPAYTVGIFDEDANTLRI